MGNIRREREGKREKENRGLLGKYSPRNKWKSNRWCERVEVADSEMLIVEVKRKFRCEISTRRIEQNISSLWLHHFRPFVVHKKTRNSSRAGIQVLISTPHCKVNIPLMQHHRYIPNSVSEIPSYDATLLLSRNKFSFSCPVLARYMSKEIMLERNRLTVLTCALAARVIRSIGNHWPV